MHFRDGCTWFFDQLHANEIPLLIFSAGIGDVIIEVIKHQATLHDNMKIVSNYLEYDAQVSSEENIGFIIVQTFLISRYRIPFALMCFLFNELCIFRL